MGELELALSLRAQGASSAEVRGLVSVAGALALVPEPEIDGTFADDLEAFLMTVDLEETPVVTPLRPVREARPATPARPARRPFAPRTSREHVAAVVPLPRRRFVVRKAIAVAIAAAMLLALPVAAGATALPSSPFYKVKLGLEALRMHFTPGALAKGFYQLELAQTRIEEGAQELALGHTDKAVEAIWRLRRHQSSGTELIMKSAPEAATLAEVATKLRSLVDQLADLLPNASTEFRPTIIDAMLASEGLANSVSGATVASLVPSALTWTAQNQAAHAAAVDQASGSASGSAGRSSDDAAGRNVGDRSPADPNRTGQDVVDSGCRVPGSADGLEDTLAPLEVVFCG